MPDPRNPKVKPVAPKPKERNPDPYAAEFNDSARGALNSIERVINPPRTIDTRNTLSARGSSAGGGEGADGGGGGGEGMVAAALREGLLGPYREEQGPRRMARATGQAPSVQQYMAQQLLGRVSPTGYSPGVLATRERQRAQQELAGLGLPQQAQAAALARIQQGDTGVVNRAAQLVSQVPPQAMGRGAVGQYLAQQLLGDAGAQEFDARRQADLARYRQVAQANTERAQGNSAQAIKFGLDPLSSEQQLVAEQRRRNQQAYQSADMSSLQKLAAAGDIDAARAIEGQPGPWAPGSPQLGVRARTQMEESAKSQLAFEQQQAINRQRYEIPARIEQETARMRELGLDRRALMRVNQRTGQPETFSADQVMRTYQTALKAHEHANGTIDDFPNFFDWASRQGFQLSPQVGTQVVPPSPQPSPQASPQASPGGMAAPQLSPQDQAALATMSPQEQAEFQQWLAARGGR